MEIILLKWIHGELNDGERSRKKQCVGFHLLRRDACVCHANECLEMDLHFIYIYVFNFFKKMLHSVLEILNSMCLHKFRYQTVTEDIKLIILLFLKWQLTLEVNSVCQDLTRQFLRGSAPLGCQIHNIQTDFKSLDSRLHRLWNLTPQKKPCYHSHDQFYQQL